MAGNDGTGGAYAVVFWAGGMVMCVKRDRRKSVISGVICGT